MGPTIDHDEIICALREGIAAHLGLQPHTVVLVARGTIPKTSSGKIQRLATRDAFLSGALAAVRQWRESDARPAPPAAPSSRPATAIEGQAPVQRRGEDAARQQRPDEVVETGARGPETIVDMVRRRAREMPDARALSFVGLNGEVEASRTFREVDHRAAAIAASLHEVLRPGQAAALVYAPGLEFVDAFLGCLYAGVIAVPLAPPDPARLERSLADLARVARAAEVTAILTTGNILALTGALFERLPEMRGYRWLATDAVDAQGDGLAVPTSLASIAYLQFTSGSTAEPRGVVLRHAQVMSHLGALHTNLTRQCGGDDVADARGVWWMPHYHDGGLIGGILHPLHSGFPMALMSPVTFLRSPLSWLRAISNQRANLSGGPNFAYDYCVRKIPRELRATLDLSSWEVACNCAEPIRPETLDAFASAFEESGFRRTSFSLAYGLAEATLLVTVGMLGDGARNLAVRGSALELDRVELCDETDPDAKVLASSGRVLGDQEVIIADPVEQRPADPGTVGEILVRGGSVGAGYWNRPGESVETFENHLPDHPGGPFLRTGDLGFFHDGQLYVTGRKKNVIIVRGRNHYPQDIERVAEESSPMLRPGCGAAFGVEVDGEERLVFVAEVRDAAEARSIEKSARSRPAAPEPPPSPPASAATLGRLEAAIRRSTSARAIDASRPVAALGLDSLAIMELQMEIASEFGIEVEMPALVEATSLRALAGHIEHARGHALEEVDRPPAGDPPPVDLPAAPPGEESQPTMTWTQERRLLRGDTWNLLPYAWEIRGSLDVPRLSAAIDDLIARHDSLRTGFALDPDGKPHSWLCQPGPTCLGVLDLRGAPAEEMDMAFRAMVQDACQGFDFTAPPLIRFRLARFTDDVHRLVMVANHMVADGWSGRLLASHISRAYAGDGAAAGRDRIRQASEFARWQRQEFSCRRLESSLGEWQERLPRWPSLARTSEAVEGSPRKTLSSRLGPDLSRRVAELAGAAETTPLAVHMAALHTLLRRSWSDGQALALVPVTNRQDSRWRSVIGSLADILIVAVDTSGDPPFVDLVARVKRALELASRSYLPYCKVVEARLPELYLSTAPLAVPYLSVMPRWMRHPPLSLPGLVVRPIGLGDESGRRAICQLSIIGGADGDDAFWAVDRRYLEHEPGGHLQLLERATSSPNARLSHL